MFLARSGVAEKDTTPTKDIDGYGEISGGGDGGGIDNLVIDVSGTKAEAVQLLENARTNSNVTSLEQNHGQECINVYGIGNEDGSAPLQSPSNVNLLEQGHLTEDYGLRSNGELSGGGRG